MKLPIVEKLNAWAPLIASGYECPAASTAMIEAAQTIEALVAALEPFAEQAKFYDADDAGTQAAYMSESEFTIDDLRLARAALALAKGETK